MEILRPQDDGEGILEALAETWVDFERYSEEVQATLVSSDERRAALVLEEMGIAGLPQTSDDLVTKAARYYARQVEVPSLRTVLQQIGDLAIRTNNQGITINLDRVAIAGWDLKIMMSFGNMMPTLLQEQAIARQRGTDELVTLLTNGAPTIIHAVPGRSDATYKETRIPGVKVIYWKVDWSEDLQKQIYFGEFKESKTP